MYSVALMLSSFVILDVVLWRERLRGNTEYSKYGIDIKTKEDYSVKRQKTYQTFISDDFDLIKNEFGRNGYLVDNEDDFSTYDGWKETNRKVKRGEKATIVVGSKPYSQPLWRDGAPILDKKGKQAFGKFPPKFALFHRKQTECLTQAE